MPGWCMFFIVCSYSTYIDITRPDNLFLAVYSLRLQAKAPCDHIIDSTGLIIKPFLP